MAIDFIPTDYIDCGSGATMDNVDTLSLVAWVYMDSFTAGGYNTVVNRATKGWDWGSRNDAGNEQSMNFYSTQLANAGSWRTATNSLSTGVWTHIGLIYDSTAGANDPLMYINGVSMAVTEKATPSGAAQDDSASITRIGATSDTAGQPFDGRLENVRMFNRIISPQDMALLAAGYRGPIGGEVGWWAMDTAQTETAWDGATLTVNQDYIPDLSGNGNTGNPTGNPLGAASTCPRMMASVG